MLRTHGVIQPRSPGPSEDGTEGCQVAALRNSLSTLASGPSCSPSVPVAPAFALLLPVHLTLPEVALSAEETLHHFPGDPLPLPVCPGACLNLMEDARLLEVPLPTFGLREVLELSPL